MAASTFDVFRLGIGPSSSHTMGPMTAASRFVALLRELNVLATTRTLNVKLYSSLALTGIGHATDRGVLLGLMGYQPESVDPDAGEVMLGRLSDGRRLALGGEYVIRFDPARDIIWAGNEKLAAHPNALTFTASDLGGAMLARRTYFSIGGGVVRDEDEIRDNAPSGEPPFQPFPFTTAAQLLAMADAARLSIAQLMHANEVALLANEDVDRRLQILIGAMDACIERGLTRSGLLPGGLKVKRRAAEAHRTLLARGERQYADPLAAMDYVNLWALAVNEENAAGGRVVTAPTNGAAGIIPSVLRYYTRFHRGTPAGQSDFLLTAAAIGALYKRNASISGAEVGCQGEVGVACSMAAAGLCAALEGSNQQVENAAEIAMEHNLGLTCDPIGGLVQIPCIERNAIGAVKAIDAARLALMGDGSHSVSLDKVIATMKRTGADMKQIYKETSLGGLALDLSVNQVEC